MPPKKQQQPNKKTVEKKKDKVVEDKTFGLKNKKGKKQQLFIKNVTNQVKFGGASVQKRESSAYEDKQRKQAEEKEKADLDSLFRPVQVQKLSAGADPKSVLCLFFQQGQCHKGDKCKFSHDMTLAGKSEKKSMYVDARDLEEDTMDKWDEAKLIEVVEKKHSEKNKPQTDIVCKHFLHAIEKNVYGWFWECPSGGDKCKYRHALPKGFVFKKQKQDNTPEQSITIEELVENEREQLTGSGKTLTKVTLDSFLAWKERKLWEKQDKASLEKAKKEEAFRAGRTHGISGRELFEFNPELAEDDDQEATEENFAELRESDEEVEGSEGIDVTGTETVSTLVTPAPPPPSTKAPKEVCEGGEGGEAASTITQAPEGGTTDDDQATAVTAEATSSDIAIDEDLFAQEEDEIPVDEALFDVDDDLQDLNLEEDKAE